MARFALNPAGLASLFNRADSAVGRGLAADAVRVTAMAKIGCPKKTGRLANSIRWTLGVGGGTVHALVGTDVGYARAVHEGTKPHRITARNAKTLHFKVGNTDVFVRSVNHPGTRGVPFLTNALNSVRGR